MGLIRKAKVSVELLEVLFLYIFAFILAKTPFMINKDERMIYSIECRCMPNIIEVRVDDLPRMYRFQFIKIKDFYIKEMMRND